MPCAAAPAHRRLEPVTVIGLGADRSEQILRVIHAQAVAGDYAPHRDVGQSIGQAAGMPEPDT